MQGKKSAPRRSHKKSRNGCKTCVRRHIRCDESVPRWYTCTNPSQNDVILTSEVAIIAHIVTFLVTMLAVHEMVSRTIKGHPRQTNHLVIPLAVMTVLAMEDSSQCTITQPNQSSWAPLYILVRRWFQWIHSTVCLWPPTRMFCLPQVIVCLALSSFLQLHYRVETVCVESQQFNYFPVIYNIRISVGFWFKN
jgi:hypothetical protein